MKKLIAVLMAAVLALGLCSAAYAATYTDRDRDLTFEYDDALFEITTDDQKDDEIYVVLTGKDAAWGATSIGIYLAELRDGESFPTVESFSEMEAETGDKVTQGEWNGFRDVIMFTETYPDGNTVDVFIVPIYDDDGEIEDSMTVKIDVVGIEDENVVMARDDAISAVVDTLKVPED